MSEIAVLVTGASRGIGRAIALSFGKKKARVAVNFFEREKEAVSVCGEIKKLGGEAFAIQGDVSNSIHARRLVEEAKKRWGRLDVLVNNAGITRDRTILKMTDEEWHEVLNVNLDGAFFCLREAARIMVKQKSGAILNISSIVGLRGSIGNANYAAAKAGLIGLTKAAAKEFGRFNIRVNAILPGFHMTDMGGSVWGKYAQRITDEHVLGRLTDLSELADFVVHIALQRSASGQVFNFESRVI